MWFTILPSDMRRGLTQPGWRPAHTYSVGDSFLMAVGFFAVVMLALFALSSPFVIVGFAVGLLVRPAIRAGRAISRRGGKALGRLWTEGAIAAALPQGAQGE